MGKQRGGEVKQPAPGHIALQKETSPQLTSETGTTNMSKSAHPHRHVLRKYMALLFIKIQIS